MRTVTLDAIDLGRALLFALTGSVLFVMWIAGPGAQDTDLMQQWPFVLWFSATLLVLALGILAFGRMVGGRPVVRWTSIASAGVGLSSVANILEDGLRIEGFFFVTILGLLIHHVAMLATAIVIARSAADRHRLLAVLPAAMVAGILFFPIGGAPADGLVGGLVLLITWLAAAAVAVILRGRRTPTPVAPTPP
jgi:hypothetical protein